ncbi:MAG: hypothetical protein HKN43_11880, partial [Rhodothermales bacterium]|nr:hypothetical protein [Rhodothermales bacterium]
DVDNTATQLVYTVTAVPGNGVIKLSGTGLVLNDTFTQDDINNSRITYDHDGSETTSDGFDFSVDDGADTATTGTFSITVTAQNDEQVLVTNTGTTVNEGSTGSIISASMLDTTDPDNTATQLVYTVTAVPGNGVIKLSGTALVLNDTFTQDDIDNSRITYDHDGSETTSDGFDFSVDDGTGNASTGTFNIMVTAQNDSPALLNPIVNQNITEGIAFSFQIPENTFVDIDAGDILTYSAMQVEGGELPTWLTFEPVTRTFSGTPPDADTDSIAIRVFAVDSGQASVDGEFTLYIAPTSESPVLSENRITLESGDTVTLTSEMLVYSAVDTNVEDLKFEVSDISGGRFELITESGIPISGFTQVQLEAGHVVFVDDGDDIAPSYSISVNDGHAIHAPVIANVSFAVAPPLEAASAPVTNSDSQPVETLLSNSNAVSGISTQEVTLSLNQVSRSILPLTVISQIVGGTSQPEALENTDTVSDVQTPEEEPQTDSGIVVRENPMRKVSLSGTAQGSAADYMNLQSLLGQLMPGVNAANSIASIFSLDPLSQEIWTLLASSDFKESLDESNSDNDSAQFVRKAVVGSSVAVTTGLSVGYVAWMVRGGVLLSSVLSSLPAWQFIDPLPVLNYSDDEENDGDRDDSLEDIIADHSAADTNAESSDPENSEVPMHVSGRKDTRQ